jgi:hypothetical protein
VEVRFDSQFAFHLYNRGIMPPEIAKLPRQALKEFGEAATEEFPESFTDSEIETMAMGLLNLFDLLTESRGTNPRLLRTLSERESKALTFITQELAAGRQPSARSVANAVGLRSSRSGLKLRNKLREHSERLAD